MNAIENRAREIWAVAMESATPLDPINSVVIPAIIAALTPPDGYVLVPVALPVEMEIAFMEAWVSKRRCIDDPEMQDAWEAALAVRPEVKR